MSLKNLILNKKLISFLNSVSIQELCGKRLVLFSYGSGLASAMYSIRVSTDYSAESSLQSLVSSVSDIPCKLKQRKVVAPAEFEKMMKLREETHHLAPYLPQSSTTDLFPDTFYIASVDDKHRRTYNRVPKDNSVMTTQTVSNGVH